MLNNVLTILEKANIDANAQYRAIKARGEFDRIIEKSIIDLKNTPDVDTTNNDSLHAAAYRMIRDDVVKLFKITGRKGQAYKKAFALKVRDHVLTIVDNICMYFLPNHPAYRFYS